MIAPNLANDLLKNIGGVDKNDLNSVLEITSKHDDQKDTFIPSNYYSIDDFVKISKNNDNNFSSLSLNIESINAKFNQITAFVENLDRNKYKIDALLFQESWLSDIQCENKAIDHYNIPGYHTISLRRKCGRKGGILIYLNNIYTYSVRDIYTPSKH